MRKNLIGACLGALALSLSACELERKHECDPDLRIDNIERVIMHGENYFSVLYRPAPPTKPNLVTRSFSWGTDVELRDDLESEEGLWLERKLTHQDDWSCRYTVTIHLHNPQEVH